MPRKMIIDECEADEGSIPSPLVLFAEMVLEESQLRQDDAVWRVFGKMAASVLLLETIK